MKFEARIPKYRAWDKERKKMLYHVEALYKNDHDRWAVALQSEGGGHLSNCVDGVIPLELTGLKDKNGKDVCEGDILRDVQGGAVVIEWENIEMCFALRYIDSGIVEGVNKNDVARELEVIGNVFENPELLGENDEK